jgi:hypothetical protein
MTFVIGLTLVYLGHFLFRAIENRFKRESLKVGDICSIFIGENKFRGLVVKISQEIDVWVVDKIIRCDKKQIYL